MDFCDIEPPSQKPISTDLFLVGPEEVYIIVVVVLGGRCGRGGLPASCERAGGGRPRLALGGRVRRDVVVPAQRVRQAAGRRLSDLVEHFYIGLRRSIPVENYIKFKYNST